MASRLSLLRWGRERLVAPVQAALSQGLAPGKAALAVALGAWLGLIPVIFGTMLLCFLAAWALRLNHLLTQTANYAVFPLQLLLVIPFLELGDWAFQGPGLPLKPALLSARIQADPGAFIRDFVWLGVDATLVWALMGLVVVPPLWWGLRALFIRLAPSPRP